MPLLLVWSLWKTDSSLPILLLQDAEELLTLAPEKMLLKWMNFHLKKAGYGKTVTNFSSDVKVCARCKGKEISYHFLFLHIAISLELRY